MIKQALERGCVVAHNIRKAVLDTLGFTLSAGISTSKLVAKLGASQRQAKWPGCHSSLCHFSCNGRDGNSKSPKSWRENWETSTCIVASGSNDNGVDCSTTITTSIVREAWRRNWQNGVSDACRGMDEEPVKETAGALVKSITAFKSFQKISITSGELTEWIALLATDVVSRVQLDSTRNNRYPKSCTVQYTCSKERSVWKSYSKRANTLSSRW